MRAGLSRRLVQRRPKPVRLEALHKTLHRTDVNFRLTGVKLRILGQRLACEHPLISLDFCPNMRQSLEFLIPFR